MLLWIGFAVLTAGVVAFLARPLMGSAGSARSETSADLAVYRDQLRAIEAEREQGLLEASEAEAARTEMARRLLRAADRAKENGDVSSGTTSGDVTQAPSRASSMARPLVYAVSALIPLLAVGVYMLVGSPGLPGNPFAERVAKSNQGRSVDELIGLVEKRLRAQPDDGQGWEVIAPVYMKQQRYDDAARAYANSIRLNGETPDRVAGFAEALVLTNNGLIVPDARRAYQRLLKIAPDRPEPRFWLALAKEQDGDLAGGIADLDGMLKSTPGDAPWRSLVEGKLNEMRTALAGGSAAKVPLKVGKASENSDAKAGGDGSDSGQGAVTPAGPRGPRAANVAAVQQMSPEERSAFIAQMVEGLAARLAKNGNDLEGWKRLARAYKVMGRDEDAAKALSDARRAMADDGAALKALDALAKDLGIGT
jgi:cytochrome c-type biogenesis protein CcmH